MCSKEIRLRGHCRWKLLFFVLLSVNYSKVGADVGVLQKTVPKDFSTYELLHPQIYDRLTGTLLESTLDVKNNQHIPNIELRYTHQGELVHLDLTLYDQLLPDEHFLKIQSSNDSSKYFVKNFKKTGSELCHYQGSIVDKPNSRAAISTCNGDINGIVFDESKAYVIHTEKTKSAERRFFLFRASDLRNQNGSCGHQDGLVEFLPDSTLRQRRSFDDENSQHGPFRSNKRSLYVELVIVVDNSFFRFFEENLGRVHQYCKDVANIVNALYSQLNIFVILTGVVVWNERDEIELHDDASETLHRFLKYRSVELSPKHPNDHAQLLTKKKFNDNIVGKAFVGPMCSADKSGAVCVAHSDVTTVVATTMAHEMGHSFGMAHDESSCKCLDKKCIMSDTSSSYIPTQWSSCSVDSLNLAFSRGITYCLRNKPEKQLASPMCGNGILEPGEECDCGLPTFCNNKCCDPKTCRLSPNAICGSGDCCDLSKCHLKKAGSACRMANDECDLTEFCTGESEFCPKDTHKHDTAECDKGSGYCYQGICGSHKAQCRILWGSAAENSPACYLQANRKGDHAGNCGGNPQTMEFTKCAKEHAQCGRLQCKYPNEWESFGIVVGAKTTTSYAFNKRKLVECHSALFDLGDLTSDPGMSPNGAKCGDRDASMCLEQKCVPVSDLRAQGIGRTCPQDCNGNGFCNNHGHCHCFIGFGGSTCRSLGPGGSVDSGPATNANSYDAFQRFLYILFCGVIPVVMIFIALFHFGGKYGVFKPRQFNKQKSSPTLESVCSHKAQQSENPSGPSPKSSEGKLTKSDESFNRCGTASVDTSLHSVDVDVRNLPKVAESIENLTQNPVRNSLVAKSASNYELSTLSSSETILPTSSQKATAGVEFKKPFKSSMALATGSKRGPNRNLKSKLEITEVRLQSSTNPLAIALSKAQHS